MTESLQRPRYGEKPQTIDERVWKVSYVIGGNQDDCDCDG